MFPSKVWSSETLADLSALGKRRLQSGRRTPCEDALSRGLVFAVVPWMQGLQMLFFFLNCRFSIEMLICPHRNILSGRKSLEWDLLQMADFGWVYLWL